MKNKKTLFGVSLVVIAAIVIYGFSQMTWYSYYGQDMAPKWSILNPFRNKRAERYAEELLQCIRCDSIQIAMERFSVNNLEDRVIQRECEFKLHSWKLVRVEKSGNVVELQYQVLRQNYPDSIFLWVGVEQQAKKLRIKYYGPVF